MAVKICQKKEDCIGCGACAALDPTNWEMNGDKAELTGATEKDGLSCKTVEEAGSVKDAENACPVKCITVTEE